jgi:hypothetical protein
VIDRLIAAGQLPNFARFRASALCAVTDAEEQAPNLEPWIQWVTVHTGQSFAEHGCFILNQGNAYSAPRIWDLVCRAGGTAWVCGSMNAAFEPTSFRGHFVPDPWANEALSYPDKYFDPYTSLVRRYVQEHSTAPDLNLADYIRFARFMVANGLSAATASSAIRQLARERFANAKWRRAMILDRLQWDMFKGVYRRARPDFATFFLNSTAHFQHFHWREMEPDLFSIKPSPTDLEDFADCIPQGYRNMDRVVGQAMELVGDDGCLVLTTALSQQPMLIHEEHGGRQIFRHRDIGQLLDFAGVAPGWQYEPVMSQQFLLNFADEAAASSAALLIEGLRTDDGHQLMWARRQGKQLDSGCMIDQPPGPDSQVISPASNRSLPFAEMFYPLEALRSGMHHPDGVFWIKAPGVRPKILEQRISLRQVAPTLAQLAGVHGEFALPSLLESAMA